jgi:hypothetical protein
MPIVWDLLSPEARQKLCEYQFARYKVLPEVQPPAPVKVKPVEEEADNSVVREMTAKPHPKGDGWRR